MTQTLLGTTNGKGSSRVLLVHLGGRLYVVTIKDEQSLALFLVSESDSVA